MYRYRKHGNSPFSMVILHGGPGAAGDVHSLAVKLSKYHGILEPLQTEKSIEGQIDELHNCILEQAQTPITLIGFSWGAWLAGLFAAKYPHLVKKVVLIGAGAFEEKYINDMASDRMERLSKKEQEEVEKILLEMNTGINPDQKTFQRFGKLMSKADAFDYLDLEEPNLEFRPDIFKSVWPQADNLRKSGLLLKEFSKISCPLTAIHGLHDPHPHRGVEEPLNNILKDFKMIKLNKCGHSPWKEKQANKQFLNVLLKNILPGSK